MTDSFDNLLEAQFRGIGFPVRNVKTDFSHDMVEHKYPDLDGARIESTGRNPMQISFTACFWDRIFPAKNETWVAGTLYPQVYQQVFAAMQDRSTAVLQHPQLGTLNVKPVSWSDSISGDRRGGTEVELSFVETLVDNSIFDAVSADAGSFAAAQALAFSLDNDPNIDDLDLSSNFPKGPTFSQSLDKIRGIINTPSRLSQEVQGEVEHIKYRANQIIDACKANGSVIMSATRINANKMKANGFRLAKQIGKQSTPTGYYVVKIPTTLVSLSVFLKNTVDDLVNLNPKLATAPVVEAQTLVRYYV